MKRLFLAVFTTLAMFSLAAGLGGCASQHDDCCIHK